MTKVQDYKNIEMQVKELLEELELKERIESTVQAQLEELSRFYSISETLATGEEFSSVIEEICESVSHVHGVDGAWINLLGKEGRTLLTVARRKVPENLVRSRGTDEPDSPVTEAIKLGKVTIIDDCSKPQRFLRWCARAKKAGFFSAAVYPLIFGDNLTGLMVLVSTKKGFFSGQVQPLLRMYANQATCAVRAMHQDDMVRIQSARADFHEKQYRFLLEQLSNPAFILDSGFSLTFCNDSFARITGKDVCDIVGRPLRDLFVKNDSLKIKNALISCLSGVGSSIISRTDGTGINLEVIFRPLRAEKEEVIGLIGLGTDLTASDTISELNNNLRNLEGKISIRDALIEDMPVGTVLVRADGGIISLNPCAMQLLGIENPDVVGKSLYLFMPMARRAELATAIATALHTGYATVDTAFIYNGDDEKPVMAICRKHRDESGEVVTVYLKDMTDSNRLSEENFRTKKRLLQRGRELEETMLNLRKTGQELGNLRKELAQTLGKADKLRSKYLETKNDLQSSRELVENLSSRLKDRESENETLKRKIKLVNDEKNSITKNLDVFGNGLLIVEKDTGLITDASVRAMNMFGYSGDEFVGMPLTNLFQEGKANQEQIGPIVSGEANSVYDFRMVRRNGEYFDASIVSQFIGNRDSHKVTLIVSDVSERKMFDRWLGYAMEQLKVVAEIIVDDSPYNGAGTHIRRLMDNLSSRLKPMGINSIDIRFEGRNYSITESDTAGSVFRVPLKIRGIERGTLEIALSDSSIRLQDESSVGSTTKAVFELIAGSIAFYIESAQIKADLLDCRNRLAVYEKTVDLEMGMNDPMQAIQSATCLLSEKSGNLDSTDLNRLDIINGQVSKLRDVLKDIAQMTEEVRDGSGIKEPERGCLSLKN